KVVLSRGGLTFYQDQGQSVPAFDLSFVPGKGSWLKLYDAAGRERVRLSAYQDQVSLELLDRDKKADAGLHVSDHGSSLSLRAGPVRGTVTLQAGAIGSLLYLEDHKHSTVVTLKTSPDGGTLSFRDPQAKETSYPGPK